MAGIFDLFGKMEEPIRRASNLSEGAGTPRKPGIRLGAPGATPAKLFESAGMKPKGLSMRSHSDLNIGMLNSKPAANLKNKKQSEFLKPSLTQLDIEGKPISPRSKDRFLKAKNPKPLSMKSSSPKPKIRKESPTVNLPRDSVFKKPQTPNFAKNIKHNFYPEPEKLAFCYDETEHYFKVDDKSLDSDFEELVASLTRSIKTCDDEGFESDPEILPCSPIPDLKLYEGEISEDKFEEDSLDLPDISDDEF